MPEKKGASEDEETTLQGRRTMPIRFLVHPSTFIEWERCYALERSRGAAHSKEDFALLLMGARRAQQVPYERLIS